MMWVGFNPTEFVLHIVMFVVYVFWLSNVIRLLLGLLIAYCVVQLSLPDFSLGKMEPPPPWMSGHDYIP